MTLVFDTNVLFAVFITDGLCAELYRRAVLHAALTIPLPILTEREKPASKARLATAELDAIERNIRREARLLNAPPPLPAAILTTTLCSQRSPPLPSMPS